MGHIYTSADQLIGGTPLLELSRLEREEGLEDSGQAGMLQPCGQHQGPCRQGHA